MNPVTRIHSHIWSTKRISIAVYFIIKLSQLQAAKSYDSHRLIYRAIGREPRIPRHWGHGVVLERWIVEKKRRHSINSLSSLLLPSYFHARSTSLFYIFRETRVEREKRFIEISKRPRSHDPINRKTGFPYSNSPPPLVLPWFFLSFHDPPPPHDHWIVSMNQPNIYIYIYRIYVGDSTGTIGPFCSRYVPRRRRCGKMRCPFRNVRPCFPPTWLISSRTSACFSILYCVERGGGAGCNRY